jgi:NAD(P)-dependent dehydrogenase (short-subunit alcohol dehydrogenase family)
VVRDAQHAYYNASKAGLIALSQALANEWGPRGVRVNVIAPGAHVTDMMRQLYDNDEERLNAHLDHARLAAPVRRVADAADIVPTALFLASESAWYITGDVIRQDGGRGLSFD